MRKQAITISTSKKALFLALAIALSLSYLACIDSQGPVQAWFDSHWSRRVPITVGPVAVDHELRGYQIKLSLKKGNFDFSQVQSRGQDVRVTSEDGGQARRSLD